MVQIGLGIIGGALVIGGACALAKVGMTKRKTHPGVAVAMIVIGLATIGGAIFGLPEFLR